MFIGNKMSNKTSRHHLKANSHYCDREKGAFFRISHPKISHIHKIKSYVYDNITGPYFLIIPRFLVSRLLNFFVPFHGALHKKYYSNNELVICLTAICNQRCFNCVSSCEQAPDNDSMSLDQIEKFVREAIELEYYWNKINLTGGEPTLHPQIFEIFDALEKYKNFNPDCEFVLVSNGVGEKVESILSKLPKWVVIANSKKEEGKQSNVFIPFNMAPIDSKIYSRFADFSKGCQMLEDCQGLALSKYGYYPTSPCVLGIDRVLGFDIGIKKLSLVDETALRDQMRILCKYCGIFKRPYELITKPKMSPSWKKAYSRYKKQKPTLSRY
jgi:hypothetical protein